MAEYAYGFPRGPAREPILACDSSDGTWAVRNVRKVAAGARGEGRAKKERGGYPALTGGHGLTAQQSGDGAGLQAGAIVTAHFVLAYFVLRTSYFYLAASIFVGVIQVFPSFSSTDPVTVAGFDPVHTWPNFSETAFLTT